jgi:hypothetical protein
MAHTRRPSVPKRSWGCTFRSALGEGSGTGDVLRAVVAYQDPDGGQQQQWRQLPRRWHVRSSHLFKQARCRAHLDPTSGRQREGRLVAGGRWLYTRRYVPHDGTYITTTCSSKLRGCVRFDPTPGRQWDPPRCWTRRFSWEIHDHDASSWCSKHVPACFQLV